ncbi:MAG: hypothetical protein A2Y38_08180 [Spirochaetes bacterium GWB1_59_5]|nr:MAG: hypothetical protein A2Y38_08180 [Spirochaetes bacterium GWB1_59_5]
MSWLADHLNQCSLSEADEGYALGRGAKAASILEIGLTTWQPLNEPPPLEGPARNFWLKKYGPCGEKLLGWLTWPLLSPRGRVIGFAARRTDVKVIERYLLPEAAWNPIWTGMTPERMRRIWDGADIWVVEGIFDLFPLEWAVSAQDVVLGSERARLTAKHVEFLRRHCRGWVRMVYDNDQTGRRGVEGWYDEEAKQPRPGALARLKRVGVRCLDVRYRGKDPGEVWKQGGAAAVRAAFTLG